MAGPDWEKADKRSEVVYKASNYGLLGGIVLSLAGSFSGNEPLQRGGDATYTTFGAAMAGSALRQRRSIVERGVKTTGAWGYSAWLLHAATVGLGAAAFVYESRLDYDTANGLREEDVGPMLQLNISSLACSIGAILTASKQHTENAYRRSLIGRRAQAEGTTSMQVAMQPFVGNDGTLGLGATAIF